MSHSALWFSPALIAASLYLISSVGLVCSNKMIFSADRFPFPVALSAVHVTFTCFWGWIVFLIFPSFFPWIRANLFNPKEIAGSEFGDDGRKFYDWVEESTHHHPVYLAIKQMETIEEEVASRELSNYSNDLGRPVEPGFMGEEIVIAQQEGVTSWSPSSPIAKEGEPLLRNVSPEKDAERGSHAVPSTSGLLAKGDAGQKTPILFYGGGEESSEHADEIGEDGGSSGPRKSRSNGYQKKQPPHLKDHEEASDAATPTSQKLGNGGLTIDVRKYELAKQGKTSHYTKYIMKYKGGEAYGQAVASPGGFGGPRHYDYERNANITGTRILGLSLAAGAIYAAAIGLGNLAYLYCDVGFLQMAKQWNIIIGYAVGLLFGLEHWHTHVWHILFFVFLSGSLTIAGTGRFSFIGLCFQLASMVGSIVNVGIQVLLLRGATGSSPRKFKVKGYDACGSGDISGGKNGSQNVAEGQSPFEAGEKEGVLEKAVESSPSKKDDSSPASKKNDVNYDDKARSPTSPLLSRTGKPKSIMKKEEMPSSPKSPKAKSVRYDEKSVADDEAQKSLAIGKAESVMNQNPQRIDALSLVLLTSPVAMIVSCLIAGELENNTMVETRFLDNFLFILVNTVLAFAYNFVIAYTVKHLGVVSFLIVSIMKDQVVVFLDMIFLKTPTSFMQMTGFLSTCVLTLVYMALVVYPQFFPEERPLQECLMNLFKYLMRGVVFAEGDRFRAHVLQDLDISQLYAGQTGAGSPVTSVGSRGRGAGLIPEESIGDDGSKIVHGTGFLPHVEHASGLFSPISVERVSNPANEKTSSLPHSPDVVVHDVDAKSVHDEVNATYFAEAGLGRKQKRGKKACKR